MKNGKLIDNFWTITCQFMAVMKKVYVDLINNNLYVDTYDTFQLILTVQFLPSRPPSRPAGVGGAAMPPPPDFGRSVNPISSRGADYAHHITTWHTRIFRPSYGPASYEVQWEGETLDRQVSWLNLTGWSQVKHVNVFPKVKNRVYLTYFWVQV